MAQLSDIPFATEEGKSGPIQNSNEHMLNMFVEISKGRSQMVRRQRPCLSAVYSVTGEKRCIERFKGVHYIVIGTGFYSFDGTTLTSRGTLTTSTGRCTMIFNDNNEVMVADGIYGYKYDIAAATFVAVTTPASMNVGTVDYLGGFGVANDAGTGRFYSTSANDFSAFAALDFATAEASPDPLYRVFVDHNELWLAGDRTIEIWQLSGGVDFPFQAVPTATIQRGIAAKFSMASEDGTVIALGDDLIVYRFDGYRPNRMSSDAVEEAIKKCTATGILNAYATLFTIGGKKFYVLTIPGEYTALYNFATGLWSTAASFGSNSWDMMGSAGRYSDYYLTATGICSLSTDINQDEGVTVVRLARSAPGWASGRRITMHELYADCEMGRTPIGVTAEVMLRVARDAETFGNIRTVSLGAIGEYGTRAVFRGLGQGRKPVLELSASGNFNFAIMGVELNATVANS